MDKILLLEKLTDKKTKMISEYESLINNSQIRNIAFASAGYLSKASKNRLYSHRERIGKLLDNIGLLEICIKIVEQKDDFVLEDLYRIAVKYLSLTYPEYTNVFRDACFPICKVKEMMNLIFQIYNVPYKKEILSYGMNYLNNSGCQIKIKLKE